MTGSIWWALTSLSCSRSVSVMLILLCPREEGKSCALHAGNCLFNSGASLGLYRGCPIPPAAPEDGQAHGAQRPDPRMPTWAAMVFSALRFGRFAANQCKLFTEGQ